MYSDHPFSEILWKVNSSRITLEMSEMRHQLGISAYLGSVSVPDTHPPRHDIDCYQNNLNESGTVKSVIKIRKCRGKHR